MLSFLAASKRNSILTNLTFVKNTRSADRRKTAARVEFIGRFGLPESIVSDIRAKKRPVRAQKEPLNYRRPKKKKAKRKSREGLVASLRTLTAGAAKDLHRRDRTGAYVLNRGAVLAHGAAEAVRTHPHPRGVSSGPNVSLGVARGVPKLEKNWSRNERRLIVLDADWYTDSRRRKPLKKKPGKSRRKPKKAPLWQN